MSNLTLPKPIIRTKRSIAEAFVLATTLTTVLSLITLQTSGQINWIETASVYFSFACTWLCTRQVRFNYVLGIISTTLLAITFWQSNLLGSMVLNIYLIPTVIYGWFIWGKDTNPKPVEHVKPKSLIQYAFFTTITWYGAYLIITHFDGSMGRLDGWLLVGSVLAQFLLDRKKIETWVVWILVNIVSVYVYWQAGLHLLALQFGLFLVNACIGYYQWNKTLKTQNLVSENETKTEKTASND